MEFEHAKRVGVEGESLVAEELARLAPIHGLTVLHDLVLSIGPMTAQLDHVVIDRFGVLIIESKVRRNALIKGNDKERKWTACYPGGKNASFQNPLRQNLEHENLMRQALEKAHHELDPDYVKSAVVILSADISELKLDSLSRERVADLHGLEDLIHRRHTFALNPGDISAEEISRLAGLLQGLDRSQDAAVMAHHAQYRGGKPGGAAASRAYTPPARPRPVASPRPTSAPAKRPETSRTMKTIRTLSAQLLGLLVILLAAWYFLLGPGLSIFVDQALSGFTDDAPAADQTSPATVGIDRALEVLQETAPEKVPGIINLDSPVVTQVAQGTTYTWEHVSNATAIPQATEISLTLDSSGNLVGANIP